MEPFIVSVVEGGEYDVSTGISTEWTMTTWSDGRVEMEYNYYATHSPGWPGSPSLKAAPQ
jgi:hypothetical protein